MNSIIEISVSPDEISNPDILLEKLKRNLSLAEHENVYYKVLRRSLDARKSPVYRYRLEVSLHPIVAEKPLYESFLDVSTKKSVIIVGAGPAGYFAALECLELGLRPIVLERGKNVRDRRRDLRAIQQFHTVHPDSNYCFGEGGAGTYSDGKLYTRSDKRGNIKKVLRHLIDHGATNEIAYDAHPHIGSNRLPDIIQNIRATVEKFGGEVLFDHKVTDLIISNGTIKGVVVNTKEFLADAVILSTGHSARDIFYLIKNKGLAIEAKSFALGVRIEHPQSLIDSIQYHHTKRHDQLPPAAYSLTCTLDTRGVFSFCMCPGGLMVPAATAPGEIVLNGMSLSRRDSKYANSGTVVSVHPHDISTHPHEFSCLEFQQKVEQQVFTSGDGTQKAPAQRLTDFMKGRISNSIQESSYIPGLWSAPVHDILPKMIVDPLRKGIQLFATKMKGYLTEEAVVVATESRTSSPVRIPRNSLSMHPQCAGLFPCGEGAGYAGGIMSAAMDGQHCAHAANQYLESI